MLKTADAVVVGGGVMGCSILFNLATRGMSNTILLEKDALASGSTSRSQAILRMHYSNEVTTRMAWESLAIFRDFEHVVGSPSGYVRTGYFLVVGKEDRSALLDNVAMQRRIGVNTKVVSEEEATRIAPFMSVRDGETFAYEPESGYADPYLVTTGYARGARGLGANINLSTQVTGIEVERGRVRAVVTPNGKVHSPLVVVAAGPWSGPLLASIGVPVPLHMVRHQICMLQRPKDRIPDHPTIADVIHSFSTRPDTGPITLVGIGEEDSVGPDEYNQGVDMETAKVAINSLAQRIPDMSQATFQGGWSGLFTATPDWHPILGQIEGIEGLYCAVGFSGHGFKLSPLVGAVMAELVTQGEVTAINTALVSELGLHRFKTGQLMTSRYRMKVLA